MAESALVKSLFEDVFRSTDLALRSRDKFLSRLFGIFSEDVVRHWCRHSTAPYEDLGRPSLRPEPNVRYTLDFLLRDRKSGAIYVAEQKCELEFDGCKYLRLKDPAQLDHHKKDAFKAFLQVAADPSAMKVTVGKEVMAISGGVLIWGATTPDGIQAVTSKYGIVAVLSIEEMIHDLCTWADKDWLEYIAARQNWANQLFDHLAGRPSPT
jgi:hypothetical protein